MCYMFQRHTSSFFHWLPPDSEEACPKQWVRVLQYPWMANPYIVSLPKSGRLHPFDMELIKNKNEIPQAIIATISDYTLWHRRMGHAHQHMIKHLGKQHRRWSSPNHRCTSRSLWGMWKGKVQETSLSQLRIRGQNDHLNWFILIWTKCQFSPWVDTNIPLPT